MSMPHACSCRICGRQMRGPMTMDDQRRERAEFKNFHRLLCERFGYAHDEIDWKRDQLSLIEHIANSMPQKGVDDANS